MVIKWNIILTSHTHLLMMIHDFARKCFCIEIKLQQSLCNLSWPCQDIKTFVKKEISSRYVSERKYESLYHDVISLPSLQSISYPHSLQVNFPACIWRDQNPAISTTIYRIGFSLKMVPLDISCILPWNGMECYNCEDTDKHAHWW